MWQRMFGTTPGFYSKWTHRRHPQFSDLFHDTYEHPVDEVVE